MKFFKEWKKLNYPIFTTIRKNTGYYYPGKLIRIDAPEQSFFAEILSSRVIKKKDVTKLMAWRDADCSVGELLELMNKFYGESYDDFILLTLAREKGVGEQK